ncbi:MAG TPA: helix-turn-helix transcriptional regulator [Gammaproteobacteria bacterium]|nr:helix-turn-helix transcriptional regulator [Gammaproteobacteria bacterium]
MDPIAGAEARIKQLCCMGGPSEAIIPAVLKELQGVLPACGSTFFWCGEDGEISNLYDDPLTAPEVIGLYLREFYGRPERELNPGLSYLMQHYQGVVEFSRILLVDRQTYLNSDFYNLILRPPGYAKGLHLFVRAGGRPQGDLAVWRGLDDVAFTTQGKQHLQGLESFIAHALGGCRKVGATQASLVDEDEHGELLIVDRMGKIQHISAQARKLLFLATHPQVTPRTTPREAVRLPAEIIQACRKLVAIFEGKQEALAPPVYEYHNPWGGFVFRAYWLDNGHPLDSLIGITIRHQIPRSVRIIGQLGRFSLSRRQMQTCVLLASGYSDADIAREMNMSLNTVITHNRRIYEKLNVHSRAELINELLGGKNIPRRS